MHINCRVCDHRYDMQNEDFMCPHCSNTTFSPVSYAFNWHGAPPELAQQAMTGSPIVVDKATVGDKIAIEWLEKLHQLQDPRGSTDDYV